MEARELYTKLIQQHGLQQRNSQLEMIEYIDQHFDLTEDLTSIAPIMIEAPTGVGKSIAYLIASLPRLIRADVKYIVSTASKVLQDQLISKDIPEVLDCLNLDIPFEVAKGRDNYLCLYKLDNLKQGSMFDNSSVIKEVISSQLQESGWDGDLNKINTNKVATNKLITEVGCDKHSCIKKTCSYFANCFYYKKRELVKKAQIIVTNHALLSTVSTNLPKYFFIENDTKALLCVDEAHNLPKMFRDSTKDDLTIVKIISNVDNHQSIISHLLATESTETKEQITETVTELVKMLNDFLTITNTLRAHGFISNFRSFVITPKITPEQSIKNLGLDYARLDNISKSIAFNAEIIDSFLLTKYNKIIDDIGKKNNEVSPQKIQFSEKISRIIEHYKRVKKVFSNVDVCNERTKFNHGVWLSLDKDVVKINYSDIEVAEKINHQIYQNVYRTVLVSATLSINGDFSHLKRELGLTSNSICYRLPHVFNYPEQGQLFIPKFSHSPRTETRTEYESELAAFLNNHLSKIDGGVLVLFTNTSMMKNVYSKIAVNIKDIIKVQADGITPSSILGSHVIDVAAGKPSIIFGSKSFFEGIDLKDKLCTKVIITALPFLVPGEPIYKYSEYNLKLIGKNGFNDLSLPEAAITLIQMVGRLIRSEQDSGEVIICDNRVNHYQILLKSLPPLKRKQIKPVERVNLQLGEIIIQIEELLKTNKAWISYAKLTATIAGIHCFEPLFGDSKSNTVANIINRYIIPKGNCVRLRFNWKVKIPNNDKIKSFYCNFIALKENMSRPYPEHIEVENKLLPLIYSPERYQYSSINEVITEYIGHNLR